MLDFLIASKIVILANRRFLMVGRNIVYAWGVATIPFALGYIAKEYGEIPSFVHVVLYTILFGLVMSVLEKINRFEKIKNQKNKKRLELG